MVYVGFFVFKLRGIMGADLGAHFAADTKILVYMGLSGRVHFHFSCSGTASHPQVFQRSSETGSFMPFKMIQGNDDVRVHDSASDLGFFYICASFYWYKSLVGSL